MLAMTTLQRALKTQQQTRDHLKTRQQTRWSFMSKTRERIWFGISKYLSYF